MKNVLESVIKNVLMVLYKNVPAALIFAVLSNFTYLFAYESNYGGKGCIAGIRYWLYKFRTCYFFRKLFLFTFTVGMILFETLLNRKIWQNPLSSVMANWWIWKVNTSTGERELTTECIENLILMLPLIFTFFWTFTEKLEVEGKIQNIMRWSIIISFSSSLSIEMLQLILHMGTFQFSDLLYNTVGGVLGGILYWIIIIKNKKPIFLKG